VSAVQRLLKPFEIQHAPSPHSWPSGQQVTLVPMVQTRALGQHVPFTQVAPVWQHWVSHGVVPAGHAAHVPLTQLPLQQSVSPEQSPPFCRHIGVVDVEVVLVDVEVVLVEVLVVLLVVLLVVVVVVCVWQLPLEQFRLQHWSGLVQCLPLRLHPGGSPAASPMPSDPSVPPTRAAPINLRALPRERLPSASPLARSSKKLSSLAIGCLLPERRDSSAPRC